MIVTIIDRDGNEIIIDDVRKIYVESDGNMEVYDGCNNIVDTVKEFISIEESE